MAIGSISIWAISPIARPVVPERVQYVVADSFYSKRKWVDGVVKLGWNSIGKLRQDANLKYLGLAESVVQVNTVWICRPKKVVRVQEKQVK